MKKVVIIGGGFSGALVANKLQRDFDVTLVDNKEYFEFTPGILRVLVEPRHMDKIQIKHKDSLDKGRFICGKVTNITSKYVLVNNKKFIFDYLVIATGSRYSTPIKNASTVLATRGALLHKYHARLQKARDVLIIGGGPVGVELAAEICTHFPEKKLTVIHASSRLMERTHPRASEYARAFLEKRGVRIICGEFAREAMGKRFVTDKGTNVEADIAFICTGIVLNAEFMKKHFSSSLTKRGTIGVNEFLQVRGTKNVFAGGDITNIAEEKTAQSAEKQARVIVNNIRASELCRPLKTYCAKQRAMVISLGKCNGIFIYKRLVVSGFFPAAAKALIEMKTMRRYRYRDFG